MENSSFDLEKVKAYVEKQFDESALPSLVEYIKIDNLSRAFDSDWNTNGKLTKAAEHIMDWILTVGVKGLTTEIIKDPDFSPIIFTEIKGDLPQTIFYYGHFDKQPPFEGWWEGFGPTIPVIKDGKLYGRGGADDGYSTYGTILSIKALQEQGVKLPRCIMITEGDEESGSAHMAHYLEKMKDRIGSPELCFCLDSGTIDYDSFWLTNSLRGMLSCVMTVKILEQGVHSGDASGIVASSFRIARSLLSRLEDENTGIMVQDFKVDVPPNRYKELYECAQVKGQDAIKVFPYVKGAQPMTDNPLTALLNRGWNPTLSIVGAADIPAAEKAGNVLRPQTTLKLSLRLPPTLQAEKAKETLQKILTSNIPYNAQVSLSNFVYANGWNAPAYSEYLSGAIDEASEKIFERPTLAIAEGGTIPLMGMFSALFPKAEYVVTGVLGPESNAHGPNEFLHLAYVKKVINAMALILGRCAEHFNTKKTQ